jgi:hypothetical protein
MPNHSTIVAVRPLLLAVAGLAVASEAAFAQTDVIGVFSAAGGYTDNVLSAPDMPTTPAEKPPEPDSYGEVRPGLLLNVDGKLSSHRFSYLFVTSVYANHKEANSYLNRAEYNSLYLVSPRTDLQLTLGLEQGEQNSFANAAIGQVSALPPGAVRYVSGNALESVQWSASARWRFIQELSFNNFYALKPEPGRPPQPRTYTVESHLALQREDEKSLYGVDLRNNYGLTTEQLSETGMVLIPEQAVVINTLMGRWRRALGRDWETEVAAGPIQVFPAEDTSIQVIEPGGLLALRYITEDGEVELQGTHDAGVNIFLGQTFITDQATLRGALPLVPEGRLGISAIIGYLRGREFDAVNGRFNSIANVFTSEASITWRPEDQFELSLRYNFFTQKGELTQQGMDAGAAAPATYLRNTVLLEVTGTVGGNTPRNRRQIPGRARVGGERRDFIEGEEGGKRER